MPLWISSIVTNSSDNYGGEGVKEGLCKGGLTSWFDVGIEDDDEVGIMCWNVILRVCMLRNE